MYFILHKTKLLCGDNYSHTLVGYVVKSKTLIELIQCTSWWYRSSTKFNEV